MANAGTDVVNVDGSVLSFPRELEPFVYLMFRGEGDPRMRTSALTIAMLDVVPDFSTLRTAFDRASRVVLRLRQHVVVPALPIAPAQWIIDPDFDLDYHVRRIRLAEPGSIRALLDLASTFLSAPLDTARPLWEAVLVEGVTEGDAPAALFIKIHHAVTDGVGGIELFRQLYDFERVVDRGPMPPIPTPAQVSSGDLVRDATLRLPNTTVDAAARATATAVRAGRKFLRQPARTMLDASDLMASAQRVLGPSNAPPSPLLRRRSYGRRFETAEFPLADIKAAGRAAGGTVNDAFIAALCGGLRMYHDTLGVPVKAVALAMPVNLRTDDDPVGGNRFAGARLAAPVGEPDPARRIAQIREQVSSAIDEPAINIMSVVAPIASMLPTIVLASLASSAGGVDVQASNIPGYPTSPYIAGAQITKLLPFGPLPGVPIMVIMLTMAGTCYVGVHYDTAAITDPDAFAKCLRAGFDEVLAIDDRTNTTPARDATSAPSKRTKATSRGKRAVR
jgi:diacylglycerol O-acyltransferase / wax synthase